MSNPIQQIRTEAEFDRLLAEADRPVLVEFYKGGGCPTCVLLTPFLKRLAQNTRGGLSSRIRVDEALVCHYLSVLRRRYRIAPLFPTVILFVGGQERRRWILNYSLRSYRRVLDEVTAARFPP